MLSVAAAPRAGASWSRAGTSRPGQLVELSRAVGTGTLSRAGLSQPARSGSAAAAAVGTRWQLAYLCPLYFWSYSARQPNSTKLVVPEI